MGVDKIVPDGKTLYCVETSEGSWHGLLTELLWGQGLKGGVMFADD